MAYEFKPQDVFEFADRFTGQKHQKGNELYFDYCPYCGGGTGNKKDKETFSVNLDNGTFNCFRSSCGKSGHFVELARDFDFSIDFGEIKKYKKISQKKIIVRDKAVEYLQTRGIGRAVAERYHITTTKKNESVLVFPFHDEENILQFIKYRNTNYNGEGNKEWCEKDTKPILFGMAQCINFGTLTITEGQIDSLSVAESGIDNAVSVPTGAMGFTWLQHNYEWISKFEEIVVFGDCEKGKITLVDELQRRLTQKIRVVQKKDYLGEKDANAILQKFGKERVIAAVENAKVPRMKSIKELADVKKVDLNSMPKVKTGINEIDRKVGGLYFGQVCLLTGKSGEGKSTFMSQMAAEALEQNESILAYSGELPDFHFKAWLNYQLAGKNNIEKHMNEYGDEYYTIPEDVSDKIDNWYRGRAYIYDNQYVSAKKEEKEELIEIIEKAIKRYNVKIIYIDNLMTAMDLCDTQGNLYSAQGDFVGRLKDIAKFYNVLVVLVAHPRKSKEGFKNDDVSGSSDITNKVDVIMAYSRSNMDEFDSKLEITKNRLTGKLVTGENAIGLFYSDSTKRITSETSKLNKEYSWQEREKTESSEQEEIDNIFI